MAEKDELNVVDYFKKAFYGGIGALFMTEEAIRQILGELKLPQEIMKTIVKNAQKGKAEVLSVFRQEFHEAMKKINISNELGSFLENHDVHIDIRFGPKKK